ncbi:MULTISPECIES: hypothetical protein [unclassified Streptomyces]|uniref:hypothetical protein n=1 Tax=unclassified Streptomyces TaxID=2593676 RepID=UPI0023666E6D|nr:MULTISPECIES: hypothetical protein [unclassified Streptomyces]MDF3147421.1 hypothetical protein [Streptomyces sp. T21Q-yed]WDF37289.1 hypothetical protein PBV52_11075 [Streptomyces sp. T12]
MRGNRAVAYLKPGTGRGVRSIDHPTLMLQDRPGRTTAPKGQVLGHEITGEVVEHG